MLLQPMVHYAELHGLLYASATPSKEDPSLATQCPVAMFPAMVPAKAFHDAIALARHWNAIVDTIARDVTWLHETLSSVGRADPFTGRLLEISKAVHREGLRQHTMLGIHRSDYMLHEPEGSSESPRFLQIELNTIASSMSSHAANIEGLHRFLLGRYGMGNDSVASALRRHYGVSCGDRLLAHVPQNVAQAALPAAIHAAHMAYGAQDAVVLFVCQAAERNFADQRWIEYSLWETHGVRVVRHTLTELHSQATMDPTTGKLLLQGGVEVSVVYHRAGYVPSDFPTEAEWEARALLEKSLAIKCPSVDYQLVGAKKVQQAMAVEGVLEKFLGSEEGAATQLRSCFAGLWGLGPGVEDEEVLAKASAEPEAFVLKPQREGGGFNHYGEEVARKLGELSAEERSAYILMQRILPKSQVSAMTREGQVLVSPSVSEFGFYSTFLGDGKEVHLSQHAGHLVRTKAEGVDEGGVAAGYAVINSPFLVS